MIPTVPAKTIVTRVKYGAGWFGVDYNMNVYRGCCHGCIYCDSRSNCYRIDGFDTVHAKKDALRIIRGDLQRKIRPGVVGTGAMSDPYNPFERTEQLTRHALELLSAFGFGVAVATKSDLILRDADVLQEIALQMPVICKVTITAANDALAAKLEPHAPSSSARFAAVRALCEKGLFAGLLLMPVLPFLEDSEENVLSIVRTAAQCGARFIYPAFGVTMRDGQREYFYEKLDAIFPGENLSAKYARRYGPRYQCPSPRAKMLWGMFSSACDEAGILYRMEDIIRAYKMGYADNQLSFFQ